MSVSPQRELSGRSIEVFRNKTICFAGNASFGVGGQGEFLRQMAFTLDSLPHAQILSRYSKTDRAESVQLPFTGFSRRPLHETIKALPFIRRRQDWLTLLSDLDFDRRIAECVEDPDLFDGIIAQCRDSFKKLRKKKTKLILTCLNTHIDNLIEILEAEHTRIGYIRHSFIHPKMRERALQEIELSYKIRVNSEWAKGTFVERGVPFERIHVIHPAVDQNHFYPVEKRDDVFRVLAVSSIDPRKGVHYLLEAFEQANIPQSELVIIGGTGDRWSRKMLEGFLCNSNRIKNRILDVMSSPVTESYGSASVLVHPALEDGYGLVVPQALASGRPVIATRQSGASALIQHGKNGFVVESRSVKSIKEYLQLLASDRSLLESMSEAAPQAVAHLSYPNFASEVLDFYEAVLT